MSTPQIPDDPEELRALVGALLKRIETLEDRVDELSTDGNVTGAIDRYDGYVLDKVETLGREPTPREIVRFYKEAGVRDTRKIKDRHRFLKQSGRIETAVSRGGER